MAKVAVMTAALQNSVCDKSAAGEPVLSRVQIKNYKSIAKCDIELRKTTILVGRNGSGKSNFLDALRFVVEGLQSSLDHAIKSRGGIDEVRRRSTGHPRNFAIGLRINLPGCHSASYMFEIAARPQGGFVVKKENLESSLGSYRLHEGTIQFPQDETMPPPSPDRLFLVSAAGLPKFRPVYDALVRMGFYNLNPEVMKRPQKPDAGELLHRDGSNIASVLARLEQERPEIKARIQAYLSRIVPGIADVIRMPVGSWETLEFRQEIVGAKHPWKFYAPSMSDGTLRALGALVAVTQLAGHGSPVSLVGLEEPETALHPAAGGAMMEALREASSHTQIVVTTHSPDLIDALDLNTETLLAVQSKQGNTEMGVVDSASREAIRDHLYSPGDLLRMDQLGIEPQDLERQAEFEFEDTSC